MNVMIGIDPHTASHTAVAVSGDEDQIASGQGAGDKPPGGTAL